MEPPNVETNLLPRLPTEILVMIFQHLPMSDLAKVRITCHHWYDTVCHTSSLMERFMLSFKNCRLYEGCEQTRVLSKTKSSYSKVTLKAVSIEDADTLWRSLGRHLQDLTLNDCSLSGDTMVQMLRLTPHLKYFALKTTKFEEFRLQNVTVDFRLTKLETLTLRSIFVYDECFDMFMKICPRLKVLKLNYSSFEGWGEKLVQFVQTVRSSLEGINLSYTKVGATLLHKISTIERLRLKKISLKSSYDLKQRDIIQLSRVQPSIVHLNIDNLFPADDQILSEISRNLPNMKRIKLHICRVHNLQQSFLCNMQRLEYLKITDATHVAGNLDLSAYENVHLEKLYVSAATFSRNTLPRFFEKTPNIRSLTLYQCSYENIHDLQLSFAFLKALEYLNLQRTFDIDDSFFSRSVFDSVNMPFERIRFYPVTNLTKLCYLNLSRCRDLSDETLVALSFPRLKKIDLRGLNITAFGIRALVRQCPRLEYVHVDACKRVCDNAVLLLCRDLKRLKLLNLDGCRSITDASVDHVANYGRTLAWLNMMNCPLLSEDAKHRLENMRSIRSLYV
ncbi:F-box and leucine-rich repeat protein 13-like [Malaya genurostris]|uniref:F-box and leucine-rich repeat protein 13-like n=1 Tax=Malaya genurostris TaxID=325434 RepID=UPI0026F391A6|nr:F-box and leucine-rich repeat protein 13-like [Malaya genurostris]